MQFLYETAVMDGVPVFNLARHGLRGAMVTRVEGILNSTTNAILGALERGGSFAEALARAQREGFAEADPRDDLEGWDGAVKLSALANAVMGVGLATGERSCARGSPASIRRAPSRHARAGARLKLVCEAWRDGASGRGRVALREVPASDPFALVEDTSSILRLVTDLAGSVVITEERPDIRVTAYGVISDLLAVSAAVSGARPARQARPPDLARAEDARLDERSAPVPPLARGRGPAMPGEVRMQVDQTGPALAAHLPHAGVVVVEPAHLVRAQPRDLQVAAPVRRVVDVRHQHRRPGQASLHPGQDGVEAVERARARPRGRLPPARRPGRAGRCRRR